jgi:hypothetical protein
MTTGVSGLRGLWRRSMISWPDGTRDSSSSVRWLQGLSMCIDLRQPAMPVAATPTAAATSAAAATLAAPAQFAGVRALSDLSINQCAQLAQQQGFAGRCTFDGSHFVWSRSIDFQPRSLVADAGSLHWEGTALVETGRDIAYVESWHRDSSAATLPVAAAVLHDAGHGSTAVLLRVGAVFMFARDRALPLAGPQALADCVAGAATLQQAQQLVDCEVSFGSALPSGFQITASTLPWRIGALLDPRFLHPQLTTLDCAAHGGAITRRWEIVEAEGDISTLAAAELSSACGS